MLTEAADPSKAAPLFAGWQETMIWSCLQGVMGRIYLDSPEEPRSAAAFLGDFIFYAGEPSSRAVLFRPEEPRWRGVRFLVPQTGLWAQKIEECYGGRAQKFTRYAIKKEPDVFDRARLQTVVDRLPAEYSLRVMDEALFDRCRDTPWCRDFVAQYKDYAQYRDWGLGVAALKGGEMVAGASSYSSYRGGIEIEIDTREDFRRRGLALACGAQLILLCLARGLYPSWDAHNLASVALAEKLGYHLSHPYTAYGIEE